MPGSEEIRGKSQTFACVTMNLNAYCKFLRLYKLSLEKGAHNAVGPLSGAEYITAKFNVKHKKEKVRRDTFR
jgi:hypothetical protein